MKTITINVRLVYEVEGKVLTMSVPPHLAVKYMIERHVDKIETIMDDYKLTLQSAEVLNCEEADEEKAD